MNKDLRYSPFYQTYINSSYEKMGIAKREVLIIWASSPLAIILAGAIGKPINIKASHVLYETSSYGRVYDCYTKLLAGEVSKPIDVDEYRVNHLTYYVPNDGNHRAAAAMMHNKVRIKAVIRNVIDLSFAPFIIIDRRLSVLGKKQNYLPPSGEKLDDRQFAVAEGLRYMQTYDFTRIRREKDATKKHKGKKL